MSLLTTALQGVAILLLSILLGTTFGIWRGYDPTNYAATTFIEMHQGAVRGLNVILPVFGLITVLITAALAVLARERTDIVGLYVLAFIAIAAAGLVTRFGNQPINDQVMGWTITSLPPDWAAIRDRWVGLNAFRVAASFVGEVLLIGAIFADRA